MSPLFRRNDASVRRFFKNIFIGDEIGDLLQHLHILKMLPFRYMRLDSLTGGDTRGFSTHILLETCLEKVKWHVL